MATTYDGAPTPVEGLEESLQVEMTHVPIPVFGEIDSLAVDESFESGPGRFGEVESAVDVQFPEHVPAAREAASALRGAQADVSAAQVDAATTMNLARAGLLLGGVGARAGFAALFLVLRLPR